MSERLTLKYTEVPNFGTSDERLRTLGWQIALIGGVHRNSMALDLSNQHAVYAALRAVDPDESAHGTMRASHWAVGWYDHLVVDPSNEAVMRVLRECADRLADYPILDEDHYSQLEHDRHADSECDYECPYPHCDVCHAPLWDEHDSLCETCSEED